MKESILKETLRKKWESLKWPGLPPFRSELNKPACDLMEKDTFVAGCISQIIQTGSVDKRCESILVVDQALTDSIAATNDPKTQEFLEYKTKFDDCIRLAQKILQLIE